MTGLFKSNPRRKLRKLIKEKKYDEALKYGHGIEKTLEHDPDISFIIGTTYFILGDAKKTICTHIHASLMHIHAHVCICMHDIHEKGPGARPQARARALFCESRA